MRAANDGPKKCKPKRKVKNEILNFGIQRPSHSTFFSSLTVQFIIFSVIFYVKDEIKKDVT